MIVQMDNYLFTQLLRLILSDTKHHEYKAIKTKLEIEVLRWTVRQTFILIT